MNARNSTRFPSRRVYISLSDHPSFPDLITFIEGCAPATLLLMYGNGTILRNKLVERSVEVLNDYCTRLADICLEIVKAEKDIDRTRSGGVASPDSYAPLPQGIIPPSSFPGPLRRTPFTSTSWRICSTHLSGRFIFPGRDGTIKARVNSHGHGVSRHAR